MFVGEGLSECVVVVGCWVILLPEGDFGEVVLSPTLDAGVFEGGADLDDFIGGGSSVVVLANDAVEVGGADEMVAEFDGEVADGLEPFFAQFVILGGVVEVAKPNLLEGDVAEGKSFRLGVPYFFCKVAALLEEVDGCGVLAVVALQNGGDEQGLDMLFGGVELVEEREGFLDEVAGLRWVAMHVEDGEALLGNGR